jgi:hypothetical protein
VVAHRGFVHRHKPDFLSAITRRVSAIAGRSRGAAGRFEGTARDDSEKVGPAKGRFRTFPLAGLRNFKIKHARNDKALKRGGGQQFISLDTAEAERRSLPDLSAPSPETALDQQWAARSSDASGRGWFRELLRAEVARTVGSRAEAEARELLEALALG